MTKKLLADETQGLLTVARGTVIRCLEGQLWITQDGDSTDYIIKSGEKFVVDRKGKVVLQALYKPSTFSLN